MKEKKRYTFRKLINDLHLWLGVGSALILFLVCLSGTIYTFRHDIEQLAAPEKYKIEISTNQKYSFPAIIAATQQTSGGKVTRISFYDDLQKPYELQISKSKEDKRGETYFVNPFTNKVLGTGKGSTTEFFMFFFKMHRWLLLPDSIGRPIVGAATIILILLTFSGLFLWLPKKFKGMKSLKPGLKIRFSAKWKRINHDIHNVLGFYSFAIVLIMAFTGLNWSFDWYKNGLSNVLGAKVFAGRDEKKLNSLQLNSDPLSIDAIIAIGNITLNYQGKTTISLAKGPEDAIELRKQNAENFNKEAADKLVIDQYSGKILKKEIFSEKSLGEKIAAQIKPIHTGEIYGTFSKIIYFIACLIATSMPITGIFIWLNKMKKNKIKTAAKT